MPKCPYCGRWFRTKRGLKQHITKTHTMPLIEGMKEPRIFNPFSVDLMGEMKKRAKRKRKEEFWF